MTGSPNDDVHGTRTRKVDNLVKALGDDGRGIGIACRTIGTELRRPTPLSGLRRIGSAAPRSSKSPVGLGATHACFGGTAGGLIATLKPQSPDEKDADKNGHDDGPFWGELL